MNPILIDSVLILSYLFGSIPFGLLVGFLFKIDIRKVGSGNIGSTNILRTLGIIPALIVFILDTLKGTIPIYLAQAVLREPILIIFAGLAAILGHMFSIFIGFKGGRGVATGFGVLLGIAPEIAFSALALEGIVIAISRYVSVASIITAVFVVVMMFVMKKPLPYAYATLIVSALIVIKHIPNIQRLISHTEPKIGKA